MIFAKISNVFVVQKLSFYSLFYSPKLKILNIFLLIERILRSLYLYIKLCIFHYLKDNWNLVVFRNWNCAFFCTQHSLQYCLILIVLFSSDKLNIVTSHLVYLFSFIIVLEKWKLFETLVIKTNMWKERQIIIILTLYFKSILSIA